MNFPTPPCSLVGRATALSLPDISEFDDETMIVNNKTIAIMTHRNVGHEQHVPDLPGYKPFKNISLHYAIASFSELLRLFPTSIHSLVGRATALSLPDISNVR